MLMSLRRRAPTKPVEHSTRNDGNPLRLASSPSGTRTYNKPVNSPVLIPAVYSFVSISHVNISRVLLLKTWGRNDPLDFVYCSRSCLRTSDSKLASLMITNSLSRPRCKVRKPFLRATNRNSPFSFSSEPPSFSWTSRTRRESSIGRPYNSAHQDGKRWSTV